MGYPERLQCHPEGWRGPAYRLALSLVLSEWVLVTKRVEVGDYGGKRVEGVTQILEGMASRNKEAFLFRLGRLKFWNWSQVAWGSLTPLPDPVENGGEETSGRINSRLLN